MSAFTNHPRKPLVVDDSESNHNEDVNESESEQNEDQNKSESDHNNDQYIAEDSEQQETDEGEQLDTNVVKFLLEDPQQTESDDEIDEARVSRLNKLSNVVKERKMKRMKIVDEVKGKSFRKDATSSNSSSGAGQWTRRKVIASRKVNSRRLKKRSTPPIGSKALPMLVVSSKEKKRIARVSGPSKPLTMTTRTSPSTMVECVQALTDEQKEAVREIGFGGLLCMKLVRSHSKLGHYLVENLDDSEMVIHTTGGSIRITSELVKDIFGIPNGSIDIDAINPLRDDSPLVSSWNSQFKGNGVNVSKDDILEQITETGDYGTLFKLNFITLFVNSICKSYRTGFCMTKIVNKVAANQDFASMDWCSYVVNNIRVQKRFGNQTQVWIHMLVQ